MALPQGKDIKTDLPETKILQILQLHHYPASKGKATKRYASYW